MKIKTKVYLFTLVALVAGYLMISPVARAASPSGEDSKEVSQYLNEAKVEAHELEQDVNTMESFTRSDLTAQSHATTLNEIGDHINKAGKLLAKLHAARDGGSAWQQKAIDEIEPLLKELAANTKMAMEFFNDNKRHINVSPTYQEYLKSNCGLAKELSELITDYVDYGFHKAEFDRLGEKVVASER